MTSQKSKPLRIFFAGQSPAVHRAGRTVGVALDRPRDFAVAQSGPPFWSRAPGFVRNLIDRALTPLFVWGCDWVYVLPLTQGQPAVDRALAWASRFRRKVAVDFYISRYEALVVDRGAFAPDTREAKELLKAERALVRQADVLVFLNRAERDYYLETLGCAGEAPARRDAIIPLVAPSRPGAARRERAPGSPFSLVWWGRLGNPLHGLAELLDALAELQALGADFRAVFAALGTREELEALVEGIRARGLAGRVGLRSDLSFADGSLDGFLAAEADLALGVFGKTAKARVVMANKIVEALAFGLPCATEKSRAVDELLGGQGLVAGNHDAKGWAARLAACARDPESMARIGKEGRVAFERVFAPEVYEREFARLLGEMRLRAKGRGQPDTSR